MTRLGFLLLSAAMLALESNSTDAQSAHRILADPAGMLQSGDRVNFVGANAFGVETGPHGRCLRSIPNRSASALFQRVEISGQELSSVVWSWRVDKLPASADLRRLKREDVGATIMFIFGEPSFFNRDVPTIGYVWTATPVDNGAVLASQRYRSLAYLQLRGRGDVGRWQEERRNVLADFRAIFGRDPGPLRYIAVFNDNDQTNEAVSALFGPILSAR